MIVIITVTQKLFIVIEDKRLELKLNFNNFKVKYKKIKKYII